MFLFRQQTKASPMMTGRGLGDESASLNREAQQSHSSWMKFFAM
jgi:hypothetical protein